MVLLMLKKTQALSGALFALFVAVHLLNTWLASFGAPAYDTFQGAVRAIYQAWLVEIALLALLVTHAASGIARMVRERGPERSTRQRWHRYAGVFLLVFMGGHIMAVRGPSWFFDVYPGFGGLAFSIDYAPYYFYPYYFLLAMAGFYHGLNGLSVALPRLGLRLPISNPWLVRATGAAAVLTLAALLGLHGVWTDVGDPYATGFAKLALELVDGFGG